MRVLLLDIETAPHKAYVWKLFDENVGLSQLIESGYILCWSAKWLGEQEIAFQSIQHKKPRTMLKQIHKLLSEADAVIHYNGARFDIPTLNREFLMNGYTPPSSYKQIDLLTTARNRFKFASNKLEYVAKALGVGEKMKHEGFELWSKCLAGDEDAWARMEEYNKNDVVILEEVYYKFLPWIKNHPNMGLFTGTADHVCPHCHSGDVQRRGYSRTTTQLYQRYQCNSCGTWSRARKSDKTDVQLVTERV